MPSGQGAQGFPSQLALSQERGGGCGSGRGRSRNRKDQLPVGRKLAHYQAHWTKLFPLHPEIVRKVSQSILIAFNDATASLLPYPLELPSNNKTANLLHPVQKFQVSPSFRKSDGYCVAGLLQPPVSCSETQRILPSIHGLGKVNQFIVVPLFTMETLFSIITALQPREWITKIDLKDVYHHILVYVNL